MTSSASHRNPDSPDNAKSPAFQFYPGDFLSDANVIVMSLQERGAYITLICICWAQGTLPDDTDRLARLCGVPVAAFRRLWPALEPCFRRNSDTPSRLIHPRLEREREKQANFARRQSDRGKLGGRPRKPEESGNKATAFPPLSGAALPELSGAAKPEKALPFQSSSSSSDFRQKESVHPREVAPPSKDLAERAGSFLERYDGLHRKYLRGAPYMGRPNLDYLEAVELCKVFDDERLDKLVTVWMGTNDDFATKGTRTVAKFRSRASWCDELLREHEAEHGK